MAPSLQKSEHAAAVDRPVYLQVIYPEPQPYRRFLPFMERLAAARAADQVTDTILLLEHEPVITCGLKTRAEDFLLDPEEIRNRGIAVERTSRGGGPTYHGPGQLILYPIVRLSTSPLARDGLLAALEEIARRTAADFGIRAFRRPGMPGIWTERGKLAAVGYRIRRDVSFHGLSFNVDCDLKPFSYINPCGLAGEKVTSVAAESAAPPSLEEVQHCMLGHLDSMLGRVPQSATPAQLEEILGRRPVNG